MKPHLLRIPQGSAYSFSVRRDQLPYFYNRWHYHPELEMVFIAKGTGTRFIGHNIAPFGPGDLVLVGSYVPQLWQSDAAYFKPRQTLQCESLVIHFLPESWGAVFWQLPENALIKKLLEQSRFGLHVPPPLATTIGQLMAALLQKEQSRRLIGFLEILALLAEADNLQTLSEKPFDFSSDPNEMKRMNVIYQFVLGGFKQKITLQQVSALVHLSPLAFCRYFKSRANKTFSRFLMEVRVDNACKLLTQNNEPISVIATESGFMNVSNFNRQFKAIVGESPLKYRQKDRRDAKDAVSL